MPIDRAPALHIIGAFELLISGRRVVLASNARRLLAFLAVSGSTQRRDTVAGQLWSMASQRQARATLRTALWRVRQLPEDLVLTDRDDVRLGQHVRVDLAESTAIARDLLDPVPSKVIPSSPDLFMDDLLPGWEDDWLVLERERHRQLRIHALEALSRRLTAAGSYASAIDVAYRAIEAEPLRESAQSALIEAHLAEGNRSAASRQLGLYRRLLADELGVTPSMSLESLLAPV